MRCFLSYRRVDPEEVGRDLFLHLQSRFGRRSVFWDDESLPPDRDWEKILRLEIEATDVVVALIGAAWLPILNQRLHSTTPDYVRFELEHAHKCNKPVIVLPLTGANVPAASELPESLRFLLRYQSPPFALAH